MADGWAPKRSTASRRNSDTSLCPVRTLTVSSSIDNSRTAHGLPDQRRTWSLSFESWVRHICSSSSRLSKRTTRMSMSLSAEPFPRAADPQCHTAAAGRDHASASARIRSSRIGGCSSRKTRPLAANSPGTECTRDRPTCPSTSEAIWRPLSGIPAHPSAGRS